MDIALAREVRDAVSGGSVGPTRAEQYAAGTMAPPFAPELAQQEHAALMAKSQWKACRMVVNSIAGDLDVFGVYHPDRATADAMTALWADEFAPGFRPLMRFALASGTAFSFIVPERRPGRPANSWRVVTRRAAETYAVWDDIASDSSPAVAGTLVGGEVVIWERGVCYTMGLQPDSAPEAGATSGALFAGFEPVVAVTTGELDVTASGAKEWSGVVTPLIQANDRLNQASFDLLLASSFGSVVLRYVSGVDLPENADAAREAKISMALDRILSSSNPDTKFGSLPGTPMDPYIRAVASALGDFAVQARVPPNRLLSDIVNISSDTVDNIREGYESALASLRHQVDQSMELHLRARAVSLGMPDPGPEVKLRWRSTELVSLAGTADAATKLHSIGMNAAPLIQRLPSFRPDELDDILDGYQEARERDLTSQAQSIVDSVSRAARPTPTAGPEAA